jgi:hypothetical protein
MAASLKAAEAQWQDKAARSVAELTARCRAAEEAVAAAGAAASRAAAERAHPEAEVTALQEQLEQLRRTKEAEIAAAKEAAALEAAAKLKAAQAQWQDNAARSMAEVTARCQAAEEALASAGNTETDHAAVRQLNHDISSLQKSLAEREAHLEQALTRLEELRLAKPAPSPADAWHPLSNQAVDAAREEPQESDHLWRDALIVFFAVMGAVLFWPRVEEALMTAGVLEAPVQRQAIIPPAPAPPPSPKPQHPTAIVARGVNLRAEPMTSGAVLASLKSGMAVAILGQNGNWDQVEVAGADGKTQQGWVYNSYLAASVENPKN